MSLFSNDHISETNKTASFDLSNLDRADSLPNHMLTLKTRSMLRKRASEPYETSVSAAMMTPPSNFRPITELPVVMGPLRRRRGGDEFGEVRLHDRNICVHIPCFIQSHLRSYSQIMSSGTLTRIAGSAPAGRQPPPDCWGNCRRRPDADRCATAAGRTCQTGAD